MTKTDLELLNDKVMALTHTLERIEKVESTQRKLESVLTFCVGFLLSPGTGKYAERGTKKGCRMLLKKWYYGGHRSKRVALASAELQGTSLVDK